MALNSLLALFHLVEYFPHPELYPRIRDVVDHDIRVALEICYLLHEVGQISILASSFVADDAIKLQMRRDVLQLGLQMQVATL